MNNKEILKMKPGRELDLLVDQMVMGKKYPGIRGFVTSKKAVDNATKVPHYSTNVYFAERVLEKIKDKYPIILQGTDYWECQVFLPTGTTVSSKLNDSLSLAVCKVALLTVLEEESPTKIEDSSKKIILKLTRMLSKG